MRHAVLEKNKRIIISEFREKELLPDECEVRIEAAGLCSSDIHRAYGGGAYFYPLVMGHEIAGVLSRIGPDVGNDFKVGDKVTIFPLLPCFKCEACAQKLYALCQDYDYYGSRRFGGFTEKLNVKKWNLVKIPECVEVEDGALVEPTAVVLHALDKLKIFPNDVKSICILGAGFLGLIAVQVISKYYPRCKVSLVDRNQFKLNIGALNGATTHLVNDTSSWENFLHEEADSFDRVIELVGSPDTFSGAISVARPCSHIVWAGNISRDLNLSQDQVSSILRKELTISGSWNSVYKGEKVCDWEKTLKFMSEGLKPSDLVSLRIGLDEINETLEKLHAHKQRKDKYDVIKVLVHPNSIDN